MPKLFLDSKPINLTRTIFVIIILILLAGNFYFGLKYSAVQKELKEIKRPIETHKINEKVLNFAKFFIEKVLRAEGEVDFETRLKLETAVRELEDEEILAQWQKFVNSETEIQAQQEVKNLLSLLIDKIRAD